ncbi:MAG: WbqC family protein [Actinobacteria bacterium]|nr:WbqC family protein [Actinomycetota bacterium]
MAKRVAIVQSCYIPWKGYFDLINKVDHFLLLDDVEYSKNTWRNRNRVKTVSGTQWLTIPVAHSGRSRQRIDEVEVSDKRWPVRHWKTIRQSYARAPFFRLYAPSLEELYLTLDETGLSAINRMFIEHVRLLLGIKTTISLASDFSNGEAKRTERLAQLCKAVGADVYVSGPAARAYLDVPHLESAGIRVEWMSYDGYPIYPQLYSPFDHAVTTLDLLFNVGPNAPQYLLSFGGTIV